MIPTRGVLLYLLDANTLIDANRDYYPIARVPEYWNWLLHHARAGRVAVPREAFDDVIAGEKEDDLTIWIRTPEHRDLLLLNEDADPRYVQRTLNAYGPDLTDEDLVRIGNDPLIISYAVGNSHRTVVTTERSKPKAARANRKVPDVCADLSVRCIDAFQFTRELDFSTGWDRT